MRLLLSSLFLAGFPLVGLLVWFFVGIRTLGGAEETWSVVGRQRLQDRILSLGVRGVLTRDPHDTHAVREILTTLCAVLLAQAENLTCGRIV